MPDSGGLESVEASQRPDSQVRVFALPPRDNAEAVGIVDGFLEALTSDDPTYAVARKYLTPKAAKNWHPERQTIVLTDGPLRSPMDRANSDGDGRNFVLTGTRVASLDSQRAYQPDSSSYRGRLHLSLVETAKGKPKQWRIDVPPGGVVIGQSDFQRIYQSVNKYYYAVDAPSDGSGGGTGKQLVADPVFVRKWADPLTETVKEVLEGPTRWLNQAVTTAFPLKAGLRAGVKSLSPDDANKLKVPLNKSADTVGSAQCKKMAAQLLYSLRDLSSSSVEEVDLERSDGRLMCTLKADALVAPGYSEGTEYQYFFDSKGHLVRVPGKNSSHQDPAQVAGPLGEGERGMRSVAVSHDQERAAAVSADGRSLFVASMVTNASLGDALVHSHAKAEKDGFTTPSWDGQGDLWVADRDPKNPRLLVFGQGQADRMQEVRVDQLDEKDRIEAVKMSADGARIALLVHRDGKTLLKIGRVERDHGMADGTIELSVADLRLAAPEMEDVTAVSWAGGSRLVVVGRESGGLQQIRYVQCDGSAPTGQALPGLTRVTEISASSDTELPLLAHSDDGIVRLPAGAAWQSVLKNGTAPVYPG
ncbi:LpqB family beta-propeller domain-containing protein [Streptomyces sp. VRA16 Mangrove soil]|uniref:LpqB family beta-propeller domain-containing protein n=1 Tax=Streptomyces sp. VRA16 Mangrove soil TaxID=2817434 RepID=UPI001A9E0156|nr:LpqB family beta-propeller domain-containing protein [Streptomyces sp. VRA16 Mangrove soil]MBO1338017.1 GerMN domain-containing protein [Streptomyces sp. VRA16 Mangrove soil]